MLYKTKGLSVDPATSNSLKRYFLHFAESQRLRAALLSYLSRVSQKDRAIISIARIAAEHKNVILNDQEVSALKEVLGYRPDSKLTEEI